MAPFPRSVPLKIPLHSFLTGDPVPNESINLSHDIFNVPLRKDIVHSVYHWRMLLNKKLTHITRTKGTTAGSGKKPF
jgi:ribosomal protein L4